MKPALKQQSYQGLGRRPTGGSWTFPGGKAVLPASGTESE